MTLLGSDVVAVLGVIDPDVTTASTVVSDWVPIANYNSVMGVVLAGTLGSSATIDAKMRQATDSSGTSAKDISGKSITQMTQAGTDQSDDQAVINVREDELDVAGGFTHVALSVTVGTATSDLGAVVLGINPTYGVASDNDHADVGEIVN
jgi:hypothetical protein